MKDFYEEANKIVESIKALDFKEISWLLEQAEKVERYEKALKEIKTCFPSQVLRIVEEALKG